MPKIFSAFLLFILLLAVSARAQDTLRVKEVEVIYQQNALQKGLRQIKMDSLSLAFYRHGSMGSLLSGALPVYIKSYGPGSLASPAFRGSAAEHTRVYWNGIPINSPMNGNSDLNLFPVFLLDDVKVNFGNASLIDGSGAVGGSIDLSSHTSPSSPLFILSGSLGSFGASNAAVKSNYAAGKFAGSTGVYFGKAENDFPYKDFNGTIKYEKNAALQQYGVMQLLSWKPDSRQSIDAAFWYQDEQRGLPPLMFTPGTDEHQADKNLRTSLRYQLKKTHSTFGLMAGLNHEELLYEIRQTKFSALSIFNTILLKPEFEGTIGKKTSFLNSATVEVNRAHTKDYSGEHTAVHLSALSRWNRTILSNLNLGALIRPEWTNDYKPVVAGALTLAYSYKSMKLYANAGRNYRFPTLNERYWVPGGNPDLMPENTYTLEGGGNLHLTVIKNFVADFTADAYYNRIGNFIIWQPLSGSSIWSPYNLSTVNAHGAEMALNLRYIWQKQIISLRTSGAYTRSTEEATPLEQLPYIPIWNARTALRWQYKTWAAEASGMLTGKVNVIGGKSLTGYKLFNLRIDKTIAIKKQNLILGLQANNLFDSPYQVIQYRPMPGRNFLISLQVNLNK